MDMTQIAMQLRTQMLQQNGVGEGQSGQISESGTSFADLIMNMLSNTQGNVQGSGLLNNIANLQQENQADILLQNGAPDSGFIDIESFASEYGGVLNTLAKEILESRSDMDTLDFSLLQKNFAMTEKTGDNSLNNLLMPDQIKSEQPNAEVKAEQTQSEQPVLNQPTEKPVQNQFIPEGEIKAEQSVLNQSIEKPVQMPERLQSEQTQSVQPEGEVKAQEPVLNQPTENPVQNQFIPEGKVKAEEPVLNQTTENPVQNQFIPEGEVKAQEPVLNQPTEKPLQNLFIPNQSNGEVKPEQTQSEQPVLNQPTKMSLQNLFIPNQPKVEVKPEQTQSEQPKGEVKSEEPVLSQPTEKPVQTLMPEDEVKAQEPVLSQPTEKTVQNQFIPEGEVKVQEPVLNQPTEKSLQNLFVPNQPNAYVKAEQSAEMPVQPEKPLQVLNPEQAQSERSDAEIKEEQSAEMPVQPEKPVQALMPESDVKAEKPIGDNGQPISEYSFREPVWKSAGAAAAYQPERLEIPLNKRNIDTLIRSGILQKAKANNKADGSRENEQNYYPVTTDNKELSYDDVLQMTNLFAMPGIKSDNSKNEVKLSDFSDSVIKADPMQLSGLLDMVTTGSSIPANNDILGSLYKETPAISGISNIDSAAEKNMAAFDFVSKYIESGEVEIVGYKPEDIIKQFSEQQLRQEQNVQENEKPVEPEAVQGENSDKAVSNNNDMLSVYRTMRTAKENMSLARKSEKTEPVEFETLQNNVSRLDIRFDKIDSEMKMNQTFEAPEKQIAKGVEENLKLGRNEFTVKLKPEGLGEIIVKLVKNDGGKMLMSMTASNVRTAQLLNRNISELQSSLSQQNVEIINPKDMTKTVMPMTPAFEQYYSHQNGGGQQQQQQQFNNRNYGYRTYSDVDDDEAFESKAKSPVENDGLNIMI